MPMNRALLTLCSTLSSGLVHGDESARINAGPFSVVVPSPWEKGVIVEKIPLNPTYTAKEWASITSHAGKPQLTDVNGVKVEIPFAPMSMWVNRPQHWAIRLPKLVVTGQEFDINEAREGTAPQILIHKSAEWGAASVSGRIDAADGKATMRRLRRALDNMDPEGAQIFFYDDFCAMKKPLKFRGGSGYRFLTQSSMEPSILERGRLEYVFVGMSDDNTCQIIATFPVDLPGLPDGTEGAEHLGFSSSRYPELLKGISTYQQKARKWLAANYRNITPSLAELDAMMQSLDARTWR